MVGPKRLTGNITPIDFHERVGSHFKTLRQRYNLETWDVLIHRSIFKWAGWVAKLADIESNRLTFKVLKWYCCDAILKRAAKNGGHKGHNGRVKMWRWERPLYKYWSKVPWFEIARDTRRWGENLSEMVEWRLANR